MAKTLQKLSSESKRSNSNDLAICDFKLGCKEVLDELTVYHANKKREIEHCFQKLIDNIPREIINTPINECISQFIQFSKEMELDANEARTSGSVIDESVCDIASNTDDFEDGADIGLVGKNSNHYTNSTSTVKKQNSTKHLNLQKIDDNQSKNIQENKTTSLTESTTKIVKSDYEAKLIFYLKDFTQVIAKLSELHAVDIGHVHDNCINDVKKIRQIMGK